VRHFIKIVTFILLVFLVSPLAAQEAASPPAGTIIKIEVDGLRRTKTHIANYPLERFLGLEGDLLDQNEVYAAVRNTGILEMVSAELIEIENGLLLKVTVHEKWAFFPFPLIVISSNNYFLGLFLADTNAFGQRDQMAFGVMYSSSGLSGMVMYNHTPNRSGLPGWNTFIMYGQMEREDFDGDEVLHRRYSTNQLRLSLGLNYSFTDFFSGSVSFSYANISLVENPDSINPPENGATLLSVSPGLSLRKSSWDGFLLSQQGISLRYGYNFNLLGSSFHQAEMRGAYERSLIPGFRAILRTGIVWRSDGDTSTNILFEHTPQSVQIDILPRNFSARHYASFSAGLEKHLYRFRWGTLSTPGSWQCVFSHGPISGSQFDHGPSGGIRFYLSRIAIPAIGLNLAYNINSGLYQMVFNMGMEF
jgi:hypothetical protein